MKKLLSILTVLALTVSMAGMTVSAHGRHGGRRGSTKAKIVYHCEEECSYCDEDGDGLCDECGNKGYYCSDDCAYIDEDGDGICDNCDTNGICSYRPKTRRGRCHH